MWKTLYGCSADADAPLWSDATTSCVTMCGNTTGAAARPSGNSAAPRTSGITKARLDLCGMKGVGHDLSTPFQVGRV